MLQLQVNRSNSLTINARTGHHAPSSGWWQPESAALPIRYLQQGDIVPPLQGVQTVWTLVRRVSPLIKADSEAHTPDDQFPALSI